MAPPRRILRQQLEILIEFLEANMDMSKGLPPGSPMLHQATRQKWAALTKKLNAVESGALKAPDGWKKYWFEWRHKCRKKAANARRLQSSDHESSRRIVPLNDLELRVLELNGKGAVSATVSSTEQLDSFLDDDSDVDQKPREPSIEPAVKTKHPTKNKISIDVDNREGTPPPKWALQLEERRIAAEERSADALEAMAATMRAREDRRGALDVRITDALTAIAGTMQELSRGMQNVLQHIHTSHNDDSSLKEVVFL